MNRAGRRAMQRQRDALARDLVRAQQPKEYGLGYTDGGRDMCLAAEASVVTALHKRGIDRDEIVDILREIDDSLAFFAGEPDLIQKAYTEAGIEFHKGEALATEKFA